ncbi:MAG: Rne/Rng family ribonuclease [Hyphomicrobiales bacterium]
MDNKMLIDAAHPEETRVVVVRGNRVEEFDFEAENKKQLKGNIYLAKVTRVEPSLQAAFVDYGGNRHGFLAFSEIHPDYYQIPVADRQALLEEEAAAHKAANEEDEEEAPKKRGRRRRGPSKAARAKQDEVVQSDVVEEATGEAVDGDTKDEAVDAASKGEDAVVEAPAENAEETASTDGADEATDAVAADAAEAVEAETSDEAETDADNADSEPEAKAADDSDEDEDDTDEDDSGDDAEEGVESVGSEDALEEVPERRSRPRAKQYKIQEVIKRRQIILVQVVKEERGNKGAALTTYLSLAGRYSVLMPNTDRGGGISRKITNQSDRKRLRAIATNLDVAEGMGVILRTAGASRTKPEINRDFEYLMRLWENVRDFTLKSSAPALVYEEGSLLKRSIRDLYNKDIKQVLVSGDEGYREAKDFMRMLMPSHAKNVQPYTDLQPIFARHGVEAQLDAMFSTRVTLKSGGYIIINQTEALVSIDVNSGRSTRESSIEETALSTNLETAEEVARQLRLRDLAGLVVIDFIDMEENRNNRAVERRLKECLRNDRARIQVGRISHFGLLEMSRQRIRASVLESTMEECPHCEGTGYIRDPASVSLHVLRAIEDHLNKGSKHNLVVRTRGSVALYVLNHKRANLMELEERFGLAITFESDESIIGEYCTISRGERAEAPKSPTMVTPETVNIDAELARDAELDAAAEAAEAALIAKDIAEEEITDEDDKSPRKRRRRRGRRRGKSDADASNEDSSEEDGENQSEASNADGEKEDGDGEGKKKRRRRGRRGGRRDHNAANASENAEGAEGEAAPVEAESGSEAAPSEAAADAQSDTISEASEEETAKKPRKRAPRKKKDVAEDTSDTVEADATEKAEETAVEEEPKKLTPAEKRAATIAKKKAAAAAEAEAEEKAKADAAPVEAKPEAPAETKAEAPQEEAAKEDTKEKKPAKSGWWQRRSFF